MDDQAAAEFYADPANREIAPGGRKRIRSRGGLTSHIPVRFNPTTIAIVQRFAQRDGQTVSAWIRRVVDKEIERRQSPPPVTGREPVVSPLPFGITMTEGNGAVVLKELTFSSGTYVLSGTPWNLSGDTVVKGCTSE